MAFDHAKAKAEFEALPEWAKAMVLAAQKAVGHGGISQSTAETKLFGEAIGMYFRETKGGASEFAMALGDLSDFARDLSAPDPSVYESLPTEPEFTADNIVELAAGEEDSAFDQPCRFGHRVEGHAVYCHNELWPGAPRKCRRTLYTGGEIRDEDCPGYAPNPKLPVTAV